MNDSANDSQKPSTVADLREQYEREAEETRARLLESIAAHVNAVRDRAGLQGWEAGYEQGWKAANELFLKMAEQYRNTKVHANAGTSITSYNLTTGNPIIGNPIIGNAITGSTFACNTCNNITGNISGATSTATVTSSLHDAFSSEPPKSNDLVLAYITGNPGKRGVEIAQHFADSLPMLLERTVRTALHRLKISRKILNVDGRWYTAEQSLPHQQRSLLETENG
jgi:hypothetical protein